MTRNRPPTEAEMQAGMPGQVRGLEPPETLTRYRVTLDLLVDRTEHNRPDEWDWPDLIDGLARLVTCGQRGTTTEPDDFGPRVSLETGDDWLAARLAQKGGKA